MNDTLRYFARDPIHRRWHHDEITFGLVYAFAEKFVLALSHDEVVHGKRALAGKMPGDAAARRAQLRVLFALMWTHPGKKLVFMGGEFAQEREWNHDGELDWSLIETPVHSGMLALMRDLNHVYRRECALFECDARPEGFRWIVVDDRERSVFAFLRLGKDDARPILVVVNATPVPRTNYVIGAPRGGFWSEILNTDSMVYGGGNGGNFGGAMALGPPAHGEAQSLELYLPPFSAILMRSESIA
jgi:1,4-alpha-glucan branching enzyme